MVSFSAGGTWRAFAAARSSSSSGGWREGETHRRAASQARAVGGEAATQRRPRYSTRYNRGRWGHRAAWFSRISRGGGALVFFRVWVVASGHGRRIKVKKTRVVQLPLRGFDSQRRTAKTAVASACAWSFALLCSVPLRGGFRAAAVLGRVRRDCSRQQHSRVASRSALRISWSPFGFASDSAAARLEEGGRMRAFAHARAARGGSRPSWSGTNEVTHALMNLAGC